MDAAAYRDFTDYRNILKAGGTYVMAGGSMKQLLKIMMNESHQKPLIDSVYPLDKIKDAFQYYVDAKAAGKIIIQVRQV